MEGMQELLDWEFKITMINMLRAIMDKVDKMPELMGKQCKQRYKNPKKEQQQKMLQIKNTITEMKTAFEEPIQKTRHG